MTNRTFRFIGEIPAVSTKISVYVLIYFTLRFSQIGSVKDRVLFESRLPIMGSLDKVLLTLPGYLVIKGKKMK